MLDFLRNLRKSDDEKTQEALTAYLDGALTPGERRIFEQRLAADEALRADLEQQRLVKENLSALPRLRAPQNFTLDPALYGRPQPAGRLYPALRTATVLAAILFVVLLSVDLIGTLGPMGLAGGAPEEVEFSQVASEPEADLGFADEAGIGVEVTRVVEEEMVIEEAEEVIMEEAAAEAPAEEAVEEAPEMEEAELAAPAAAEPDLGGERVSATPPLATVEGEAFPQDGTADVPAEEMELLPALTATPQPTPAATPSPDATTSLAEAPGAERAADDDAATAEARAPLSESQVEPDAAPAREGGLFDLPVLRILAIVLGIAVILLATATLLLRRRL